jgi:hypothetical protein
MEKSQKELLKDFQEQIARLKEQIASLEEKIAALQASPVQADDEEVDFTDIQIGVAEMPEQVGHDEVQPEPEPVVEPEPVLAPEPEPVVAPEPEPEPVAAPEPAAAPKAEDDTAHLPWRTDKPGIPVKNIRSGISLLDRALFIGTLFKEDFALYDQTIADLNAMSSLDEAVAYIREKFPHWNLKSDVVYHFMMSVRKKLG